MLHPRPHQETDTRNDIQGPVLAALIATFPPPPPEGHGRPDTLELAQVDRIISLDEHPEASAGPAIAAQPHVTL